MYRTFFLNHYFHTAKQSTHGVSKVEHNTERMVSVYVKRWMKLRPCLNLLKIIKFCSSFLPSHSVILKCLFNF